MMGLEGLLDQDGRKKELSIQQVIAKLTEAVSFYSKRKDLGKQIVKSSQSRSGHLLNEPRFETKHEGLYVRLPDLGAGEFAIKCGTGSQVFRVSHSSSNQRSAGGQMVIGGSSSSSTTLTALKIRELRDEQALAIYSSLCAMAVEDARHLYIAAKVKKKSARGGKKAKGSDNDNSESDES